RRARLVAERFCDLLLQSQVDAQADVLAGNLFLAGEREAAEIVEQPARLLEGQLASQPIARGDALSVAPFELLLEARLESVAADEVAAHVVVLAQLGLAVLVLELLQLERIDLPEISDLLREEIAVEVRALDAVLDLHAGKLVL